MANPAGFISRALAYSIDSILLYSILVLLVGILFRNGLQTEGDFPNQMVSLFEHPQGPAGVFLCWLFFKILDYFYFSVFHGTGGQTVGKMILGIRVVNLDGSDITYMDSFARRVGRILSGIFYLGYLWVLIDGKRQGWHDKLVDTQVIHT